MYMYRLRHSTNSAHIHVRVHLHARYLREAVDDEGVLAPVSEAQPHAHVEVRGKLRIVLAELDVELLQRCELLQKRERHAIGQVTV